jgi:hypothetical protein
MQHRHRCRSSSTNMRSRRTAVTSHQLYYLSLSWHPYSLYVYCHVCFCRG